MLQSDSNHLLPLCLTGKIQGIDVYVKITHVYGHKDLNINRRQLTGHSRNWALDTHVRDKIANKTGHHKQSLLRAVMTLLSTCMDIRCDDGERWPALPDPKASLWSGLIHHTSCYWELTFGMLVHPLPAQSKPEMSFEDWCRWKSGLWLSEVLKVLYLIQSPYLWWRNHLVPGIRSFNPVKIAWFFCVAYKVTKSASEVVKGLGFDFHQGEAAVWYLHCVPSAQASGLFCPSMSHLC